MPVNDDSRRWRTTGDHQPSPETAMRAAPARAPPSCWSARQRQHQAASQRADPVMLVEIDRAGRGEHEAEDQDEHDEAREVRPCSAWRRYGRAIAHLLARRAGGDAAAAAAPAQLRRGDERQQVRHEREPASRTRSGEHAADERQDDSDTVSTALLRPIIRVRSSPSQLSPMITTARLMSPAEPMPCRNRTPAARRTTAPTRPARRRAEHDEAGHEDLAPAVAIGEETGDRRERRCRARRDRQEQPAAPGVDAESNRGCRGSPGVTRLLAMMPVTVSEKTGSEARGGPEEPPAVIRTSPNG